MVEEEALLIQHLEQVEVKGLSFRNCWRIILSREGSGTLGGGGTQSAGGAAGSSGRVPAGTAGGKYSGGPGNGGAGGGGYYGGGGAGGYYSQGGGGSGYIDPTVTNSASFNAPPGSNHYIVNDDPGNSTIKPATAEIRHMMDLLPLNLYRMETDGSKINITNSSHISLSLEKLSLES